MLISVCQYGVIGRCRKIVDLYPASFKLVADRLEDAPVTLVIRVDDEILFLARVLCLLSARYEELDLHEYGAREINDDTEYSDEYRKEHASRSGIDIQ